MMEQKQEQEMHATVSINNVQYEVIKTFVMVLVKKHLKSVMQKF